MMNCVTLILVAAAVAHAADGPKSWAPDNGNGSYSNPLFYDEFSDPDMIRVGSDYYLTFQGGRYALFHYNSGGNPGGHADFDSFTVDEPRTRGLSRPIPRGQRVFFEDIGTRNALNGRL